MSDGSNGNLDLRGVGGDMFVTRRGGGGFWVEIVGADGDHAQMILEPWMTHHLARLLAIGVPVESAAGREAVQDD